MIDAPTRTFAPLDQADQAAEIARAAFDAGDVATGIAAIQFAAQLVQLARLLDAALKDADARR